MIMVALSCTMVFSAGISFWMDGRETGLRMLYCALFPLIVSLIGAALTSRSELERQSAGFREGFAIVG